MFKISSYKLSVILFSILFVLIAGVLDIRMFQFEEHADGFYAQITYAGKIFSGNFDANPLFFIHVARLIIVSPFYGVYIFKLPAFIEAIFYLVYLSPLLIRRSQRNFIQLIFIFFPLIFSYRTSIGMCGMGYLYIILFKNVRSYSLFIISALLANLSSGIVLSWVFASLFAIRYIVKKYVFFVPVFGVLVLGFSMSLIHKIGYMMTEQGAESNGNAVERSTIYVSLIYEQYSRFFIYTVITMLLYLILNLKIFRNYPNSLFYFFLCAVPGVFLEGIGLISYLMCFMFFVNDYICIKKQESYL